MVSRSARRKRIPLYLVPADEVQKCTGNAVSHTIIQMKKRNEQHEEQHEIVPCPQQGIVADGKRCVEDEARKRSGTDYVNEAKNENGPGLPHPS